jgi:hypothetical protein
MKRRFRPSLIVGAVLVIAVVTVIATVCRDQIVAYSGYLIPVVFGVAIIGRGVEEVARRRRLRDFRDQRRR